MTGDPGKPPGRPARIVKRTLADGTVREYRYAKRERKPRQPDGALRRIFNEYSASPEFARLCPAWRARKLWLFGLIEERLGWMTMNDLEGRIARTKFYELRDLYAALPDRADKMMQALSSALEWAYDRGTLAVNHARRIKPLAVRSAPKHYSHEQEAEIVSRLPDDLRRLYLVALYTGLRRADLCALTWGHIKDGWLAVQPRKTAGTTAVWVHLPTFALPPLKAALEELPCRNDTPALLTTAAGIPWTEFNVSHRWRRALLKIGIEGTWFNEIRHTTATRLVEAGCTDAERGAVMGHTLAKGAGAAYVARTKALSMNAYVKWAKALEGGEIVLFDGSGKRPGVANKAVEAKGR